MPDLNFYDFYITPFGQQLLLDNLVVASPLRISKIVVGTESYDPKVQSNQNALLNQVDSCNVQDAVKVENTWQIAGIFDGSAAYNIGEMGLETDTGHLFAVHSQPGKLIGAKSEAGRFLPRFSLNVEQLPVDSITVILPENNPNLIVTPELAQITLAGIRLSKLFNKGFVNELQQSLTSINLDNFKL